LETIQESVPDSSLAASVPASLPIDALATPALGATPRPTRLSLPPKGACWYCDKSLDSVKRFCGKTCSDAFDEEAEYTR
jgi:streptogramin lyase